MRAWACIAVYFLPFLSWSQEGTKHNAVAVFDYHLNEFLSTDPASVSGELQDFLERMDKKHEEIRKNVDFLSHLFSKVHYKFLKRYENYASFSELLDEGNYNCLTGTALYALLLERYGYQYSVIETTYHVFLLVHIEGSQVLFEATDPREGFVTEPEVIAARIQQYRSDGLTASNDDTYHFQTSIYQSVTLPEIKGLLYYNKAVDAYNQQQFERSVALLDLASNFYKSERIKEFRLVIMQTLINNQLGSSERVSRISKM